ncbi:MAG TPA: hypothetical protein VLK65_15780 [Vicinamibacteria bacterium]|nr:hypothetical protein [Vicinamibacteria bacterium]
MLSRIEDRSLQIFVVWLPAIRTDSYEEALKSRSLIPDIRARHYWDESRALGNALAPILETRMSMAWDVYLAYDGEARWDGTPPTPSNWLHQKQGEDPKRYLEETTLEAILRSASKGS